MPATGDRRSFAGARPAGSESERIEIDSRHRTRGWSFEPGFRQRARSRGVEALVAADPETERRAGRANHTEQIWNRQGWLSEPSVEFCRGSRAGCKSLSGGGGTPAPTAPFSKRNPGNAVASRKLR